MSNTLSTLYATPHTDLAFGPNTSYRVGDGRIRLQISEIFNNRTLNDYSGTLAVELWALKHPYWGGGFDGFAVAGTTIGEVFGQHYLQNCQYDLIFSEPPVGTWYFTLMLREWSETGFVTRDYVNFDLPYQVNWKPTLVEKSNKVVEVDFSTAAKSAAPSEAPAARPNQKAPRPAKDDARALSINSAAAEDLAKIKGMSQKLANSIVKNRPFTKLEDLCKVKGIGEKLLVKLRPFIKL
jgi:competence ComEA-like helix-hairpin-helix protein